MPEQNDAPLIRKGYLYILPVLVLALVLNLLFNQELRGYLGLKPGMRLSLPGWLGGKPKAAAQTAPAAKPLSFSAEEVRLFSESFTRKEVRVRVLPPEPKVVIDDVAKTNELNRIDEEEKRKEKERLRRESTSQPWPVTVQSLFNEMGGRRLAIIGGQYFCARGEYVSGETNRLSYKVFHSFDSPSSNRCSYTVLAVGQKCVWLHGYPHREAQPPLPEVQWPDVALIESSPKGMVRRQYTPTRVRFASGATAEKGNVIALPGTEVVFRVKELWEQGVVFEAVKGDQRALFACMLVVSR